MTKKTKDSKESKVFLHPVVINCYLFSLKDASAVTGEVAGLNVICHCHHQRYSTAVFSLPFFFLFFLLCCFFLHIIFRLVSFRTAPPCTVSGWWRTGLPFNTQTPAASPAGAHAVCSPSAERPGSPAVSDPAAAPAVLGETQTAIPAAATAHQQGRRDAFKVWFCLIQH